VAALKIVYDVVAFRVRRLEMANLAGAIAIMVVLRLSLWDACVRTLFAALLNVLVYLNNDYHDIALDVRTRDRDTDKSRFLHAHMRAAAAAQWILLGLLWAIALLHSRGLLLVLLAGGGICWAYSVRLKHTPWLDVAAMAAWGLVMPLCGSPLDRTLGLALALQLGLFSAVFETIQVIRDHANDAQLGVRTTAVAIGVRRTLQLGRALMLMCAAYAALVLHPVTGAITLLALPLRLQATPKGAEQLWTRIKLIYGAAFLVACGLLHVAGHSSGLWLQLDRTAVTDMLGFTH